MTTTRSAFTPTTYYRKPKYHKDIRYYRKIHRMVKALWGNASQYPCVGCGEPSREWAYDGTDPAHEYADPKYQRLAWSQWPEFYMPMCIPCHRTHDKKRR